MLRWTKNEWMYLVCRSALVVGGHFIAPSNPGNFFIRSFYVNAHGSRKHTRTFFLVNA